jgi:hypothetical protein
VLSSKTPEALDRIHQVTPKSSGEYTIQNQASAKYVRHIVNNRLNVLTSICLSDSNTKFIRTGPPLVEKRISGKFGELTANSSMALIMWFIICSRDSVLCSMTMGCPAPESWLGDRAAIEVSKIVCRCAALAVKITPEEQTRTLH